MHQTDKPTLRLISRYWNNISAEVDIVQVSSSPSLRRGSMRMTLTIPRGGVVDLCKAFGVDTPAEARAIVERSPQLARFLPPVAQMLVLVEWPPPAPVAPIAQIVAPPPPAPELEVAAVTVPDEISDAMSDQELRAFAIRRGVMAERSWTRAQTIDALEDLDRDRDDD